MAFGERLADALRRAIREEYAIELAVGPLLDVADHTLVCRPRASTGFRRATSAGQVLVIVAIAWCAPDEVPAGLTEVTRVNLDNYLKRKLTGSA